MKELDELLEHWPYERNHILYLLATHEALVQRGGRLPTNPSCLMGMSCASVKRYRRKFTEN